MRRTNNTQIAAVRRRLVAGASAFFLVATLALFIGHHHPEENDTSTCLICHSVSAPAVQTCDAPLRSVVLAAAPLPFCDDVPRVLIGWPGARTTRAPPAC